MTREPAPASTTTVDRRFRIPPLGKGPVLFALCLGGLLPAGIAAFAISQVRSGELAPAMLLVIQLVVAVSVLAVVLPMLRREVSFDDRRLRVKATFYTREARLDELRLDEARIVDLREHTELRPLLKTNGFGLPGLSAGHFRLRDRRKAFCLVSDPARVLVLPHVDGSLWLLSFDNPRAVLSVLREAAGRTGR